MLQITDTPQVKLDIRAPLAEGPAYWLELRTTRRPLRIPIPQRPGIRARLSDFDAGQA